MGERGGAKGVRITRTVGLAADTAHQRLGRAEVLDAELAGDVGWDRPGNAGVGLGAENGLSQPGPQKFKGRRRGTRD